MLSVDNILITSLNEQSIFALEALLHHAFAIRDLDMACFFLWLELCRTNVGFLSIKCKYFIDILADSGLTNAKPVPSPLSLGL